jgi:hypothetical protein
MRYSRLATNDDSLDEYTPLMLTDHQHQQSHQQQQQQPPQQLSSTTADSTYLLPFVDPQSRSFVTSSSSLLSTGRYGIFDMLQ